MGSRRRTTNRSRACQCVDKVVVFIAIQGIFAKSPDCNWMSSWNCIFIELAKFLETANHHSRPPNCGNLSSAELTTQAREKYTNYKQHKKVIKKLKEDTKPYVQHVWSNPNNRHYKCQKGRTRFKKLNPRADWIDARRGRDNDFQKCPFCRSNIPFDKLKRGKKFPKKRLVQTYTLLHDAKWFTPDSSLTAQGSKFAYDCATCKDKGWVINKDFNIQEGCYFCGGAPHGVSTRVSDVTTNQKAVQAVHVQPTKPQPAVERLRQHIWLNGSGIAVTCKNQKIYEYKKNSSSPWKKYNVSRQLSCLYCQGREDETVLQTLMGSYEANDKSGFTSLEKHVKRYMNTQDYKQKFKTIERPNRAPETWRSRDREIKK